MKNKKESCSANMIAQHLTNPKTISEQLDQFFVNFLNSDLLANTGMKKRSGISAKDIIKDILALRLNNISFGTNEISLTVETKTNSDGIYNYQKRSRNDVLSLTTRLSKKLFESLSPEDRSDSILQGGLFIVDDTTYERLYSMETELASSQFDHTDGRYYLGFRNNQLSYYNHGLFLPVNAVPVSTSNPEKAVCPAKKTGTEIGDRKRELTQTKMTEVSLAQIDMALENGFKARYCLFDTWYMSPKMLFELLERGIFGIGMVKNSPKVKFKVDGEWLTTKEIFDRNAANSQQLLRDDFYFSIIVMAQYNGKEFPVKLCFYEADSDDKEFICLATTDVDLSSKTIKALYDIRWSTEDYFADTKDIKSINANKQCQCQSLDSIYFDIAMTEVLYIFLAFVLNSIEEDYSMRTVYHLVSSGMKRVENYQTTINIFSFYLDKLSSEYQLSQEEVISFTARTLSECPDFIRQYDLASPFLVQA